MNSKGFIKKISFFAIAALFVLASAASSVQVSAQGVAPTCASLTAGAGLTYTQNFDGLAQPPTATSSTVPAGFGFSETGTGNNTTYTVGTGSSTAADTYSLGVAGTNPVTDRAFGTLISNALAINVGGCFVNNTGAALSGFTVTYDGEEYRLATTGRQDRLDFQYSLTATSLTGAGYVDVDALDFLTPSTTTAGVKDGNAPANRTAGITSTISSLSIANGATFYIRFADVNITGNDDTLAVDNFTLTAIPASAGGTPNISINDVSLNEGNAGTTAFTFTVTRSGDLTAASTVAYTTTAGTAAAGSDYTTVSGTVTFAADDASEDVVVLVNGDTTVEPNETFTVDLSGATNGNITDAQGLGTIINDDFNPTVNLSVDSNAGSEAATSVITVTATASAAVTGDQTVTLTLSGTAMNGTDYTLGTATITIPNGTTIGTTTLTVINDADIEGSETATLTITAVSSGLTIGATPAQTVTIADDDAIACTSVLINEINSNPPGNDNPFEYVEVRGVPATCTIPANTYFAVIEGDSGGTLGNAIFVVDLSNRTVGGNGLLIIKSPTGGFTPDVATTVVTDTQLDASGGGIQNGTQSYFIVNSATPIVEGTDYDTNNDGILDNFGSRAAENGAPVATVSDSIAVTDGGAGDFTYAPVLINNTGFNAAPDALSRFGGDNTPNSTGSFFYGDLTGTQSSTTYDTTTPNAVSANFPSNGALSPGSSNAAPTAAAVNVGGRITETNGRGIARVVVTMTDSQGNSRTTYTNQFGFYNFADVPAGDTYIFSATHRRYQFAQPTQVRFIGEDETNINFVSASSEGLINLSRSR